MRFLRINKIDDIQKNFIYMIDFSRQIEVLLLNM